MKRYIYTMALTIMLSGSVAAQNAVVDTIKHETGTLPNSQVADTVKNEVETPLSAEVVDTIKNEVEAPLSSQVVDTIKNEPVTPTNRAEVTQVISIVDQNTVVGTIKNEAGTPIEGVAVTTTRYPYNKSFTDKNGSFTILASLGDYIKISYAGSEGEEIWIEDNQLDITLSDKNIIVINKGQDQNFYRHTQAIGTVSGDELSKNSTQNLTNALYGLLPGLTVKQNTGWTDDATFMIRGGGSLNGTSPLVVVDGIPRTMSYVNLREVENVSILKDGAATALWGTRGANGVILVTTKRGTYNTSNVDINYQHGVGLPMNLPTFADGYTYAMARNEALYYDGEAPIYDAATLAGFQDGSNRDLYANTDWLNEGLRNFSANNQLDVALSGGSEKLRYYSAINYKNDFGILNKSVVNNTDQYDSQMKKYELSARVNLDIDVTKYTLVSFSIFGLLRELKRPNTSSNLNENDLFSSLYHVPSAAFPVRNTSGIWASNDQFKKNPIADLGDVGLFKTNERLLQADLRIAQDLSMLTDGLSAEVAVSYDNAAVFKETATKEYGWEQTVISKDPYTGFDKIGTTSGGANTALAYENRYVYSQFMRVMLEGNIGYNRAFGLNSVNAMLQYRNESYIPMGRNGSRNRQSFMFVGGYNYDNRYLIDVVVNQSGTSVLSTGDKFRTYPAVSAGWIISNEKFMNSSFEYLKLRASWGRSGNDNFGYDLDEQFWGSTTGYNFTDGSSGFPGLAEGALPIENLTCEIADKFNVGIDMQVFKNLSLSVDGFLDQRRKTLIDNSNLISTVIGVDIPMQNIGSMNTKGVEVAINWRENKENFSYYVGGNFSYLKSEILENGEGYKPYDYLSKIGNGYGQMYGLEAVGYFNDAQDIADSPTQRFSEVRPGDIKYKDQNGDNIINDYDVVAIGNSGSVPGIYFGINLGFQYKNFGVDMVFQGVGNYSRMLNTQSVYWPLRNNNSNISTWYLEDKIRWTEDTKETANVPRLTTMDNANNFRNSTQWLVSGSYFKLRNLNIYFNLPQRWVKSMKMEQFQIYLRGNNLFSIDSVDDMNVEDFSINYPDMRSVFLGININF